MSIKKKCPHKHWMSSVIPWGQCADCGARSKAYRCRDCKPVRVLLSKRKVSKIRSAAALKRWAKT